MVWEVIAFISSIIAAFMIGLFIGAARDNDRYAGTMLDERTDHKNIWDDEDPPRVAEKRAKVRAAGFAGPAAKQMGKAGQLEDYGPLKLKAKKTKKASKK